MLLRLWRGWRTYTGLLTMSDDKIKRRKRRYRSKIAQDMHEGRFGLYAPKVYEDQKKKRKKDPWPDDDPRNWVWVEGDENE